MKRYLLTMLAILTFALPAGAQTRQDRPKIGLALSGGGAKGIAHIGVIRQLEKLNVPVDYVAGTSMGAVVGALYASGMSPDELQVAVETIDWGEALSDATAFEFLNYRRKVEETRYPSTVESGLRDGKLVVPTGIRTGQKLSFLLARFLLPHLDQRDFSKLPIPYAAVAADLETGDAVVLTEGDIAEAVRASMSIPGAFTPVEWGDRILVDGGVTMNVPVEVVRAMGADIVIAVDISAKLPGREKLNSTMDILGQLSGFLTRRNMTPQLAQADLVLSPDITGITTFDFHKAKEIGARGDAEGIARRADIAKYSIDPAEHQKLVASQRLGRERNVVIDEIRVEGVKFVDERFVREQMKVKPGDTLDFEKLQKDVEWMYGWGDFIGIHAGLETSSGKSVLVMRVQEKPWGPAYVRTGLGVETRYNNPGVFLLGNYTRRWINSRGAEWRNDVEFGTDWGIATELYQPRGYDRFGFFAGSASYARISLRRFEGDDPIGEYDVRQLTFRADGGTQIGTAGEARLGLFQRWNDANVEVGETDQPEIHESEGGLRLSLNLLTTDDPFFPVRGVRLAFLSVAPLEALGAEEDYVAAELDTQVFGSYGRHVFSGRLFAHDVVEGVAPIYDAAILGGFGNLSGVPLGQFSDQAGAVAALGYRNRISRSSGLFQQVYIGGLVEAGDVAESLSDITDDVTTSVTGYLGIDTSYGPLIFGVSKAEDFETQYYIQIGKSF